MAYEHDPQVIKTDIHFIEMALLSGANIDRADMMIRIKRIQRHIESLEKEVAECRK